MQEVAEELGVLRQWLASGEAGVQLVPVHDALLAEAPAEVHRAAAQAAAEVDQAVGGLDLDAQLADLAQDAEQLLEQGLPPPLHRLHRRRRAFVHLQGAASGRVPGGGQLALDARERGAQRAGAHEGFLQGWHQRVGLAQREKAGGRGQLHRAQPYTPARADQAHLAAVRRGFGQPRGTHRADLFASVGYVVCASCTELRELTADERASYFRAMQPLWGGGLAEEAFVAFQRRLAASPEARGRYRMFGLFPRGGGDLLSGVKAYELAGAFEGAPLRILGIGAVFTPPGLRGRGYAARMLADAMARFGDEGADAALLFSDIGAEYYRRLGFHALASAECFAEAHQLPRSNGYRTAVAGDEEPMCRLFERARPRERLALS